MTAPAGDAIEVHASRDGALFRVKAQPGAGRSAVKGVHAGALKVAVGAPPEKGKANEALLRFLENALGLARGALSLTAGLASREKRLLAAGMDAAALAARLGSLVSDNVSRGTRPGPRTGSENVKEGLS